MNRFDDDFLRGYKIAPNFFDSWGDKVYKYLGDIKQCGFIELHKNGRVFLAANKIEVGEEFLANKGYLFMENFSYLEDFKGEQITVDSDSFYNDTGVFDSKFRDYWFMLREIVDNDVQRLTFFSAVTPKIYNTLINNLPVIRKMIKMFQKESTHIIQQCRDNMADLAEVKPDFLNKVRKSEPSERDRVNFLLKDMKVVLPNDCITDREWHCLKECLKGKSAQEIGKTLGISNRTVESHMVNLKRKLNTSTKAKIIELMS